MEPIASFSGLASGIQWRDMIDEIIRVESRPITLLENEIADIQARSSAWVSVRGRLDALDRAAADLADGTAFRSFTGAVSGSYDNPPLLARPSTEAVEGSYDMTVHRLAAREKVGGDGFSSSTEALGLAGEFLVNGHRVEVTATDTLADVAEEVRRVGARAGVQASVTPTAAGGARLVLTAAESGAAGLDLVDGSDGVLRDLGLLSDGTSIKHGTSDGATSDAWASSGTALGTLLALESPPPAATVTVGGESVLLDLATMGLDDVAAAVNQAAIDAGKAFRAQVVSGTDEAGGTVYRLDVSGTTSFGDSGRILEALGVLTADRAAVAQSVASGTAFQDSSTGLAADGSTALANLQVAGSGLGVAEGDTLTLEGTRGDGTTFTRTFTVGAGATHNTLTSFLTAGDDDFGSGRTASASVSADGRLTVTDGTAGGSLLGLEIVAHNEGGGTLDFGEVAVSTEGRLREIAGGRDALVEVDGTFLESASNTAEVIPGLSLTLLEASGEPVEVRVTRDAEAAVEAVQGFVDAYNEIQGWISEQFGGAGAEDGIEDPVLSGDSTLRGIGNALRETMLSTLVDGVSDGVQRMAQVGIEIDRFGAFQLDSEVLAAAVEDDPEAVERLFATFGDTDDGSVDLLSWTDATEEGLHAVEITTAAETAGITGSGFGSGFGTYQDDGVADTLVVRDLDSSSSYRVALNAGDELATVVDALNDAFGTATTRRLESSEALYADGADTAAGADTLLADLHHAVAAGGANMGVTAGDVLTLSGTRRDGGAVLVDVTVEDPATQTLQDLLNEISSALGPGAETRLESGRVVVEESRTGRSLLTLAVSSDNAGGGTFSLGTVDVAEEGRDTVAITASEDGGELRLEHEAYGSTQGFEVSVEAGGTDGSASLGLAPDTYTGVDVVGTIGGYAATGAGRVLTGGEDTPVDGLMLRYSGVDTGERGTATFSRGIAARMELELSTLLGTEAGSIDSLSRNLDDQVVGLEERIEELNARLDRRKEQLIRQFTAMEEALARAQSQADWLTAQLSRLDGIRDR